MDAIFLQYPLRPWKLTGGFSRAFLFTKPPVHFHDRRDELVVNPLGGLLQRLSCPELQLSLARAIKKGATQNRPYSPNLFFIELKMEFSQGAGARESKFWEPTVFCALAQSFFTIKTNTPA